MASQIEKDIQDFEKVFGPFKDHPGYESFRKYFIEMRAKHPEWEKPSDLPFAKMFCYIDWNNTSYMEFYVKNAIEMKLKLYDQLQKSRNEGTTDSFINSLIDDLVTFKSAALALHAKVHVMKNPSPGSRAMIHAVR